MPPGHVLKARVTVRFRDDLTFTPGRFHGACRANKKRQPAEGSGWLCRGGREGGIAAGICLRVRLAAEDGRADLRAGNADIAEGVVAESGKLLEGLAVFDIIADFLADAHFRVS